MYHSKPGVIMMPTSSLAALEVVSTATKPASIMMTWISAYYIGSKLGHYCACRCPSTLTRNIMTLLLMCVTDYKFYIFPHSDFLHCIMLVKLKHTHLHIESDTCHDSYFSCRHLISRQIEPHKCYQLSRNIFESTSVMFLALRFSGHRKMREK